MPIAETAPSPRYRPAAARPSALAARSGGRHREWPEAGYPHRM